MKSFVGFVLLAAFAGLSIVEAKSKIVCYLGSWAGYRPGNGRFNIENIDPNLCTHVIYSFVGITSMGGIRSLDTYNDLAADWGKDGFGKFNRLRSVNPELKTMVAIGGWNEGSLAYSLVMSNPLTRAAFINNAVAFIKLHGFDGFDLDWEYPAQRGGASSDKANFVSLLREMRARFDKEGLLMSAAVGCSENLASISYDIPSLSKYLDFINIMTYDIHGAWDPTTGQNAPLFASSLDLTAAQRQLSVNASIQYWLAQGADPAKLILGMGMYGRTFVLSTSAGKLGSPASGPGPAGPYTQEQGFLGYNEICEQQMSGGWSVTYDEEQQVPFAVKGNLWVGYDNVRSIKAKAEYVRSMGLGGGMIWSLETDDFSGKCGKRFPLLSAMNEVLRSDSDVTAGPTTSAPVTAGPTIAGPTIAAPTAGPTAAPGTTDAVRIMFGKAKSKMH